MKKILVIDDTKTFCTMVKYMLKPHGYEVIEAESGEEALRFLARGEVDLILLDIMMPRMDGIETLRKIRDAGCDAKVIVVSAGMTANHIKALYNMNVSAFLTKPISRVRLLKEVENALNEAIEVRE